MICSPREENISGQKFGRLTAVKRDWNRKNKGTYWVFECDCNKVISACKASVLRGMQVSCGCHKKEVNGNRERTHGLSKHPSYRTWNGMVQRCTHKHNKDYDSYGGRGITVCDRWLDVRNFIEDMGVKPKGKSLDRIDNNKGYSPENCRWATWKSQGNNKRNNRELTIDGVKYSSLAEAARQLGMAESTLRNRLNSKDVKTVSNPVARKNVKYDVGDGRMLTRSEIAKEVGVTVGAIKHRIKKGYKGKDLLMPNKYNQ